MACFTAAQGLDLICEYVQQARLIWQQQRFRPVAARTGRFLKGIAMNHALNLRSFAEMQALTLHLKGKTMQQVQALLPRTTKDECEQANRVVAAFARYRSRQKVAA